MLKEGTCSTGTRETPSAVAAATEPSPSTEASSGRVPPRTSRTVWLAQQTHQTARLVRLVLAFPTFVSLAPIPPSSWPSCRLMGGACCWVASAAGRLTGTALWQASWSLPRASRRPSAARCGKSREFNSAASSSTRPSKSRRQKTNDNPLIRQRPDHGRSPPTS